MLEKYENSIIDEQLLGMKKEEMEVIDLDKCEVVRRQFMAHTRDNLVTIKPDGIQFNNVCISKMPGVEYIFMFIDKENHRLLITPCNMDEKDSQKWCIIRDGVRKSRKINGKSFGDTLYSKLGWCKGYSYKICGVPALAKDDEDRLVMAFDFEEAERIPLTRRQRLSAGVTDEDLTQDEVLELDIIEEERAKAKEEGRKSTFRKLGVKYPDNWDPQSFGDTVENHQSRPDIPRWEELKPETALEEKKETVSAPAAETAQQPQPVQTPIYQPTPAYQQNSLFGYTTGADYGQSRPAFSI